MGVNVAAHTRHIFLGSAPGLSAEDTINYLYRSRFHTHYASLFSYLQKITNTYLGSMFTCINGTLALSSDESK